MICVTMWKKFVFFALFHVAVWSAPENTDLEQAIQTSTVKETTSKPLAFPNILAIPPTPATKQNDTTLSTTSTNKPTTASTSTPVTKQSSTKSSTTSPTKLTTVSTSTPFTKQSSTTSSTTSTTAITTTTTREIQTGGNCGKTEKASNHCSDPKAECRQEGNGYKCSCKDHYYLRRSTSTCTEQIQTEETCNANEDAQNQCLDTEAQCNKDDRDSGYKCLCKGNYFFSTVTSNCTKQIQIGGICNKNEESKNQCRNSALECKRVDSVYKCLCKQKFYLSNSSAECLPQIKIGDTCNKTEKAKNQCSDPQGVCKHEDSQDKCLCKENYYFSKSTHCLPKIRTGDTCNNTKEAQNQCSDPKAQCVQLSNGYICMCKDNYYLSNSTAVCKKQIRTGYTCNGTEKAQKQCIGPNSQCRQDGNGYKCLCNDSYYYKNSTANCTKQIQTGGICSRTEPAKNQCRDSEADCKNVDSEYKCLCNAKFYLSNYSAECSPRPPKPSIEDIKVSTSDMIFKVKIRPDTSSTNGLRIILRKGIGKNGKVISQLYMPYEKPIYRIENLTAGQCYNVEVYSLIDNNTSVDSDDTDKCTYPNMPNATCGNSEMTAINISIHKGEGNVQGYRIRVDGSPLHIISTNLSRLNRVIKSEPGTLYKIDVSAVFDSDKYSVPFNLTCATIPSPPKSVNVSESMTDQLSIEIVHGKGNAAYFDILLNQKYYNSVVAKKDSDITITDINGLVPGTLYTNFTVIAVSNGINSSQTNVPDSSTVPSVPKYANVTMETTNSITVQVTPGDGVVQYFDILMNSTYYQMTPVNRNRSTTSIVIGHLHPGTTYGDFEVIAVSHGLNSSSLQIYPHDTRPNIPTLEIINAAVNTTSISGCVHQKEGGGDEFNLYSNETRPLVYEMNGSNFIISSLSPGVLYHIWATAIFQNHTSDKTKTQMVCTVPASPHFEIVKMSTTTNSLVGNINQLIGGHDSFEVYCNEEKMIKIKQNGSLYTVGNLNPGQVYKCSAATLFCNRTSVKSNIVKECTVPASPDFKIVNMSTTTNSLVGNINQLIGRHDSFEIHCNGKKMIKVKQNGSMYTVGNLNPGQVYKCSAATLFCNRTSVESNTVKECTVPSPPRFTINNQSTTINTFHGSISQRNGGKDKFTLYCNGTQNLKFSINGSEYFINNLNPGTRYSCQASTTFCDHTSEKTTSLQECTVPSTPNRVTVQKSSNETMDLDIYKGNGGVESYIISFQPISKAKCAGKLVKRNGKESMKIDSLSAGTIYNISIVSVFNNKHSSPYIMQHATDPSPPVDVRIKDRKKDSATIEIVKGKGCVKRFVVSVDGIDHNVTASTDKNVTVYLISGLDSATMYPIKIYAVSNGAYNVEMSSIQISLTTEKDPVPVAIGSVVGVLAALIVILIVVFAWRRQALCFKKNIPKQVVQGNMNSGFEEEVELADNRRKRPIKLSDFHKHVEMMSRNTHMKFSQEFKELGILSPKHSTDESQIQENRPKNRYTNILPFDHSIVKLIGVEDEIGSDFINANYIPGKKSKREFIATQGPLPSTKEEMWRMIWEQNVSIVVMLTQLIERGRKKCEIYWPENVNEKMFLGDIIVEVETISHLPNYTLRTIALRLGDVERRIKHYNYLAWPDMGTPKTTDIMINFVDTVRQEVKPNMNGPIVVHCSAGVGRTGTFIIMDILLQEIRSKCTEVDIFGMILNMRNYRLNMVQTEDQYIFIHNCVKDLIDVSDNEEEEVGFEDQHEPIYQNC